MTTTKLNLLVAVAAFSLLAVMPAAALADEPGVRLEAILAPIDPHSDAVGRAEFRDDGRGRLRLEVEVEDVEFAVTVVVLINGTSIATIDLDANGDGQVELETDRGDAVPAIRSGDDIQIVDADTGDLLLEGTFGPRQ